MQSFAREKCTRIVCATFYDVLLRKCEKCGAGMENSHRRWNIFEHDLGVIESEPMASPGNFMKS